MSKLVEIHSGYYVRADIITAVYIKENNDKLDISEKWWVMCEFANNDGCKLLYKFENKEDALICASELVKKINADGGVKTP